VHDKWPKVGVVLVTKNKTRFGILRCNPGAISPDFFVSAHRDPSLIFQIRSGLGRYRPNRKKPLRATEWMQYRLFEPITKTWAQCRLVSGWVDGWTLRFKESRRDRDEICLWENHSNM